MASCLFFATPTGRFNTYSVVKIDLFKKKKQLVKKLQINCSEEYMGHYHPLYNLTPHSLTVSTDSDGSCIHGAMQWFHHGEIPNQSLNKVLCPGCFGRSEHHLSPLAAPG